VGILASNQLSCDDYGYEGSTRIQNTPLSVEAAMACAGMSSDGMLEVNICCLCNVTQESHGRKEACCLYESKN
jgi:hypothetical protein